MTASPFRSVRRYLDASPAAKWGAIAGSAAGAVCLALLFPLLFLFADLLVSKGVVPEYDDLTASRQEAFRQEWDARLRDDPAVAEEMKVVRRGNWLAASEDAEMPYRWRAATRARLAARVGPEAADAYLPPHVDRPEDNVLISPSPSHQRLGVLALVARDRSRWPGSLAAEFADLCGWAWRPGDTGSANGRYATGLFVIAFALLCLRGLALNLAAYCSARATIGAATRLRRALYTHGYRLSAVAVRPEAQAEAGELITRRVEHVQEGLHAWMTTAVRSPVLVGLLLVFLLAVDFWLTLALLLLTTVVWLVIGQLAVWFRRDARTAERRAAARMDLMRQALAQVQLSKAYLMERFSQTRFERHLADLSRNVWRRRRDDTFTRPSFLTVISLAGLAMLYLAGRVVLSGEMSVAGLVMKAAALGTLLYAAGRWASARARVARARDAAADVGEFLDRRADAGQPVDAEFLQPMAKQLEFVKVSLREPGSGRMLLEDVSFAVPAGTKAAVVAGDPDEARAVAFLVTRFLDPTGGEVRVDGKNTRWVTLESVRSQVALVGGEALTFADTVANNIGCGDPGFSLPQIIEAAKVAHAHQFVQRLPYGYETSVGDGGVGLTAGQRFRIALARAVLRDPSLILIDEPAEPLDADSVALVDDAIARIQPGRTIVFLTRRMATVRAADQIFVLQNGRLIASGGHDDLTDGTLLSRALHTKQNFAAI